ncbi:MAG: maltose alpha-D-glucosyltransferase [Acidobacteria bacterium 13_1_20CM_2_65_9]|nr:MAG: maltose alpha-D-glucosyltransferase [Acidobacteria bacterium 13_1_20CM_2_65_9]
MYQVHVKSFFDSNNDGIGDFQGVTQKLDYLQGLGVTCLWILPFFPSPLKDDGYDIADYRNVHPSYGTLDDFRAFVNAAHDRHIKVLIELVVNHTSDQHPWFQRARHAPKGSPERAFYVWNDDDKKFPETRIIFTDTEKSNWAYDPVAGQYYWHRFFSHQPDLNHNNPAVVDAVIDVMKFWFDFGVDAMRLDAVPYLCVRERTNNENLPETHLVLKQMRRELDASYKNRMLLAEANQWPADVRAYFGDGDECHMAFHFPLMPRMFMAVRQEDRHAITEILSQTPDIPETCQWALFLRNHDELTLEMVTDEERDYMYTVYAADPQMRLNVGIRRRLAPLVENSRRRIELLNTMLFSFPGTPIIYYGDEIGMGDNIYLGDRNGVRTPMQWTSDRNGGFSRADTARLFAPPIQDPVYGYQAINVEAQERYPFSLLNWMKRLIAMRKQHPVLGRGALEFVHCSNRKVLAYLRRDERDTILCVVNLSRAVQPAELDLKAFAGLIPVEMFGLTEFPRIGDQPYFLTLGTYASYWFTLQREPLQVAPRVSTPADPNAAILESLPALLVGVDWQTILDAATRVVLERQALAPFLQRQRWFGSKARAIKQARFTDWTAIRQGANPAFLTVASIEYADGWTESYFVPLSLVSGVDADQALKQTPGAVLARITGARKGAIVDGLQDDDVCGRLLQMIGRGDEIATARGIVHGARVAPTIDVAGECTWTRSSGDQSNSLAFFDDRYVLKLFRRIEPGPNPEFEIGRALTELGFTRAPALAGALEYLRPGLDPGTLAVVQNAVKHQGSGWEFTIDELRRYYERVEARVRRTEGRDGLDRLDGRDRLEGDFPAHTPPPFFAALENWYLSTATTLGRRTAELHLALANASGPAFAPEALGGGAIEALAREMRAHAEAALDLLARQIGTLNEASRPIADAVLAERTSLLTRFDELAAVSDAGFRIRIHGDYHLGQVLRTEEDFVMLDFEGEPARPIAERRAKQSPLKDVAGMVRSYSYAAYAALFAYTVNAPDEYAPLESWADTWQHWAADAFLGGYSSTIGDSPLVPRGAARSALIRALVLDKALYELGYELNNRPDWVRIPLIGIRKLAAGLQS